MKNKVIIERFKKEHLQGHEEKIEKTHEYMCIPDELLITAILSSGNAGAG